MKFGVARTSAVTACAVLALSISAHHAIALTASDDLPTDEVLIGAEVEGQELEEDLPIPGEPEDQVVPEPDLPEKEPNNSTLGLQCKPGWFFKITQNKKNTMSVKYKTFVENASNKPIDFKFVSKKSGTTEVGGSVSISSEVKVAVLGSIKAEINANAKKSWTSEVGVETSGKVPAKTIRYGDYGILKENVYGYKYHRGSACQKSNKKYMTVWAPYREGWRVS